MVKIRSSEITSEQHYLSRRKFMALAGAAAGVAALSACAGIPGVAPAPSESVGGFTEYPYGDLPGALAHPQPFASSNVDELGDNLNTFEEITNYNNYYEFSTDKGLVNPYSQGFEPYPWTVEVTGLVNNPKTFGIEDLIKNFDQEERIYRLRCVEAWSMVVPWVGFSLGDLLKQVDPKSEAKYVRFESILRPEQMPGQKSNWIDWPYVEGLQLDEAMNPLTILSTGIYGKLLTPANGAPLRLVVPWKYGFKSIKGIVKIELTDKMPMSTWMLQAPNEYGFLANVNPTVDHPRWSQGTERRIGAGLGRINTLMFNGYAEEVASLYDGVNLQTFF